MALVVNDHFADIIFDIITQDIMKIYSYSSKRSDAALYYTQDSWRNPRGVIRYQDIIEAERQGVHYMIFSYLCIFLCQFL